MEPWSRGVEMWHRSCCSCKRTQVCRPGSAPTEKRRRIPPRRRGHCSAKAVPPNDRDTESDCIADRRPTAASSMSGGRAPPSGACQGETETGQGPGRQRRPGPFLDVRQSWARGLKTKASAAGAGWRCGSARPRPRSSRGMRRATASRPSPPEPRARRALERPARWRSEARDGPRPLRSPVAWARCRRPRSAGRQASSGPRRGGSKGRRPRDRHEPLLLLPPMPDRRIPNPCPEPVGSGDGSRGPGPLRLRCAQL